MVIGRCGKTVCSGGRGDSMDAATTTKPKKKQQPLQRFYSVQELAEMLGVHARTIYRAIVDGRLRACKVGSVWRVSDEDLKAFLAVSYG
jgi:excisionase family DNA binding protein